MLISGIHNIYKIFFQSLLQVKNFEKNSWQGEITPPKIASNPSKNAKTAKITLKHHIADIRGGK